MAQSKTHLVVFDMNGVLFSKTTQLNQWFAPSPIQVKAFVQSIHPNVDMSQLCEFYNTHFFYIGVWTTSMHKNAIQYFEAIQKAFAFKFDCLLTQEDCSVGKKTGNIKTIYCIKDLRKPSKKLNVDLEKCMLVDDSTGKRCENQRFFLFESDERSMIKAIKAIDEFIGCTDETCIAKRLKYD